MMGFVWLPSLVAVFCGVSAIPLTYLFNTYAVTYSNGAKFLICVFLMSALLSFVILTTRNQIKSKMYYGFAFCCMSCVVDFIVGLELDGFIKGFMSVYLENCEPYLASAWGAMVCYWDGAAHFICYLLMAYYASNGLSYRIIGLHYSASILNSMIVLLVGACLSRSGLQWSSLLNVPYVLFPLAVSIKCLTEKKKNKTTARQPTWKDTLLAVLLIEAGIAALIKGLASLGSNQTIPAWYRDIAEPVIKQNEPAPFAYIQGLITLFYFLPSFIIVAAGLIVNPCQEWLQDLSVLLAGATINAGVSIVGMSFHILTEPEHRAPPIINHSAFIAFWTSNILTTIVPQVTALRIWYLMNKSTDTTTKKTIVHDKKAQIKTKIKKQY